MYYTGVDPTVNRHTGGLEMLRQGAILPVSVNRHTGGLETNHLYI